MVRVRNTWTNAGKSLSLNKRRGVPQSYVPSERSFPCLFFHPPSPLCSSPPPSFRVFLVSRRRGHSRWTRLTFPQPRSVPRVTAWSRWSFCRVQFSDKATKPGGKGRTWGENVGFTHLLELRNLLKVGQESPKWFLTR